VQEVFAELKNRLETVGYLPDEYFMLADRWENGKPWPKDGDIFCTVDYGGSEGIYLDVYLKYQDENGKMRRDGFITGKTLGESDADMDRMFLVASAVTKAFHSYGFHSRYIAVGGETVPEESVVVHLNPEERRIVTDGLLEERARLKAENESFDVSERLLRRIIGSITEYVRVVGDRPSRLDDCDRASLAVADGDVEAFRDAFRKVPHRYGELLEQAAARPDAAGREMSDMLCADAAGFSYDIYLRVCKAAVNSGDTERVLSLLRRAPGCAVDLKPEFYGDVILHALAYDEKHGGNKTHIALAIIEQCSPKQLRGANPYLLQLAVALDDRKPVNALLDKDFPVTNEPAGLIYAAAMKRDAWLTERLIRAGADVNAQNYAALFAAMNSGDTATGILLLKLGADFDGFANEAAERRENKLSENEKGFLSELKGFYDNCFGPGETERDNDDPEQGDDD
jgi:hypothetical protein